MSTSCFVVLGACAVGTAPDLTSLDPAPAAAATSTSSTTPEPVLPPSSDAAPDPADGGVDADLPNSHGQDASPPPTPSGCTGYAAPSVTAGCKCASGKTCTANNCYGGYYCSLGVTPPKCVPKPASCP